MLMRVACFFASGTPFFIGFGLVIAGALVSCLERGMVGRLLTRGLLAIGLILVVASGVPMSGVFFRIFALLVAAMLFGLHFKSRLMGKSNFVLRLLVVAACLFAINSESRHWHTPVMRAAGMPSRRMFVIGDSLSAGTGFSGERAWPEIIRGERGVEVIELNSGGARVEHAADRADLVFGGDSLVVLLIGGNDVLGGTPLDKFTEDLEAALRKSLFMGRRVVMFELPLPPFANGYGFEQRRLAAKHRVPMIPRRHLAAVIGRPGNSTDGLHLTNQGQRQLAEIVWRVVGGAFEGGEPRP